MEKEEYLIQYCTDQQIEELTEFAFQMNSRKKHGSTFCSHNKKAIREDFMEGISGHRMLSCQYQEKVIGILNCYIDEPKNNADCTVLIDSAKCDYNSNAKMLFEKLKASNKPDLKYTFFFPQENKKCADFLESVGAAREVNEYELVLDTGHVKAGKVNQNITELPTQYYDDFVKLHDTIFPGVYISGADVI
jgi:hypothetical protein